MKKIITTLSIVLLLLMCLTACSRNPLVGKWIDESTSRNPSVVEFRSDKKFSQTTTYDFNGEEEVITGTYSFDGKTVTMSADFTTVIGIFENDTITFQTNGGKDTTVLHRLK